MNFSIILRKEDFFFFCYVFLFITFFFNYKKLKNTERIPIVAILIHSLFDNILYLPVIFLIFIAILFTIEEEKEYPLNLSNLVKSSISFLSLIYLLPLSSHFLGEKGRAYFKNKNYEKSYKCFSWAESL
ncbi:MAG: hypothetical protein ABIN61_02335 [candidate division WOR-3 bacterium]